MAFFAVGGTNTSRGGTIVQATDIRTCEPFADRGGSEFLGRRRSAEDRLAELALPGQLLSASPNRAPVASSPQANIYLTLMQRPYQPTSHG
jgi:hypothetical protein